MFDAFPALDLRQHESEEEEELRLRRRLREKGEHPEQHLLRDEKRLKLDDSSDRSP